MKVKLLAFGIVRDVLGNRNIEMELEDDSTTADLRHRLEQQHPRLKEILKYAIAINQTYIHEDVVLKDTDEIAIIPPVSGG